MNAVIPRADDAPGEAVPADPPPVISRPAEVDHESDETVHGSAGFTVLHRMFAEGFATGETAIVDELCAPDLIEHQFGLAGRGAAAIQHVKDAIHDVHTTVPDLQFVIEDWIETADAIWGRVHVTGTATGPFFGPPSGRPVDFTVVDIARVVGGRIVEHWGVPDRFALLAQIGVLDRLH